MCVMFPKSGHYLKKNKQNLLKTDRILVIFSVVIWCCLTCTNPRPRYSHLLRPKFTTRHPPTDKLGMFTNKGCAVHMSGSVKLGMSTDKGCAVHI